MNNEELLRQGNLLIVAARDGRIGLSENELKKLQDSYVQLGKFGNKRLFVQAASALAAISGLFGWLVGSGGEGFLLLIGGAFGYGSLHFLEQRAKQYEELVNREYPRLEKKEAA